ncbi:MAG: FRG domain-containing protein [Bacilli bacterium]
MRKVVCYYEQSIKEYVVTEEKSSEIIIHSHSSKQFYAIKKYLCRFDNKAVFRGQNKDWKLIASIFRDEFQNLRNNEEEYYQNVKRDHALELSSYRNYYELWSQMQHFGYPTRLLDVTTNMFKALAFMIEGNVIIEDDIPPCIYIFEPKSRNRVYTHEMINVVDYNTLFNNKYPLVIPPNNQQVNIRLHAQSGQFIFFDSMLLSEEEHIEMLEKMYHITKISVKFMSLLEIEKIEEKLKEYGYGVETLYPDMIKRSDYYKYHWNK